MLSQGDLEALKTALGFLWGGRGNGARPLAHRASEVGLQNHLEEVLAAAQFCILARSGEAKNH